MNLFGGNELIALSFKYSLKQQKRRAPKKHRRYLVSHMLLETFRHILKPREKLLNLDTVYKSINFWLYSTKNNIRKQKHWFLLFQFCLNNQKNAT